MVKKLGWIRAAGRYYKDPAASVFGKLLAFLAIAYVIMPLDLIPDVPFIGWIDDIGVVGLVTAWMTRRIGGYRELPALPGTDDDDRARPSRRPFSALP